MFIANKIVNYLQIDLTGCLVCIIMHFKAFWQSQPTRANDLVKIVNYQFPIRASLAFIVSITALSNYSFLLIASDFLIFLNLSSCSSICAFYSTERIFCSRSYLRLDFLIFQSYVSYFFSPEVSMHSMVLLVFANSCR